MASISLWLQCSPDGVYNGASVIFIAVIGLVNIEKTDEGFLQPSPVFIIMCCTCYSAGSMYSDTVLFFPKAVVTAFTLVPATATGAVHTGDFSSGVLPSVV